MIDRSFIEKIVDLAQVEIKEINGFQYATKQLHMIQDPSPAPLKAGTLTSLVDYIFQGGEVDPHYRYIVHVVGPDEVYLYKQLRSDAVRECLFEVEARTPRITFGQFMEMENFNIMMQSGFVDSEDKGIILQVVGNVQDQEVGTLGDDGVSQTVVAKVGVQTMVNVKVPNPVELIPYRTFPEIDQPASKFIFRMQKGPRAALYEADGGAWRNEAVRDIAKWLEAKLHPIYGGECKSTKNENIVIIA